MNALVSYLALWHIFINIHVVFGNFRGATIRWKPLENGTKILIDYRLSWRLNTYPHYKCISKPNTLNRGTSQLKKRLLNGTEVVLQDAHYLCTSEMSLRNKWMVGANQIVYEVGDTEKKFYVGFRDCCREQIHGQSKNNKGRWQVWSLVDLTKIKDNKVNIPPLVATNLVLYSHEGCSYEVKIPVFDEDGDFVKCRLARTSSECGDVCDQIPNIKIDESKCVIYYTAIRFDNVPFVRHAVTIQVEDFDDIYSTNPKSSTGVHFTVRIFKNNRKTDQCNDRPKLLSTNQAECKSVPVGKPVELVFKAQENNEKDRIVDIYVTAPPSSLVSGLSRLRNNTFIKSLYWIPKKPGNEFICHAAITWSSKSSERKCTLYRIGEDPDNDRFRMTSIPASGETADVTLQQILLTFSLPVFLVPPPAGQVYATISDIGSGISLKITRQDIIFINPTTLRISISKLNRTSLDTKYLFEINRNVFRNKQYCTDLAVKDASFKFNLATNKNEDPSTISCGKEEIRLDFYRHYHPGYELKSAVLTNSTCTANTFNITHTSIRVSKYDCGTRIVRNTTHAQYTNNVKLTYIGLRYPVGYIIDKRRIRCYRRRENRRLDHVTKPPASVFIPKSRVGKVYMTFSKFTDSKFKEKFNANEYPLKLQKMEKLFFGIDLITKRKDLKVVLQHCYGILKLNELVQSSSVENSRIYFVKNRCGQKGAFQLHQKTRNKLRFSYKPASSEYLITNGAFFKCHVTVCNIFSDSNRCKFGCRRHRRETYYHSNQQDFDLTQYVLFR